MMVYGSKDQEGWLSEMGAIAHDFAPSVDVVTFKGVFRFAIAEALKDHRLAAWESVARKDEAERKAFLDSVLRHSAGRLEGLGTSPETVAAISRSLHRKVMEHILAHQAEDR